MIKLKSYQREAVDKLQNGCILCGAVGSGKSITALFYYFEKVCGGLLKRTGFVERQHKKPLYIITTARKRDTAEWEKECSNIGLSISDIVIDSWNNIKKYKETGGAFFIFDEQRVIGSGAWVKSFLQITRNNEWILLSATPGDTWMDYVPVFIANGFYRTRTEFVQRHCVYSNFSRYPKIQRYIEAGRLLRLRNQILVNIDFVKQTVPHIIKEVCSFSFEKQQILMKKRWNIFEDRPLMDVGELCFAMRRLVNTDPSRLTKLFEIYKRHQRLIVFYNFNYELDLLRAFCERHDITYSEWNGHKHELLPKDLCWIYLIQYAAGAEGWNCIETDTIVFYSQNYSYRAMKQAAGRIDRMNTPFTNLYYYHLISNSEIDRAIGKALHHKKNFNEQKYFNF